VILARCCDHFLQSQKPVLQIIRLARRSTVIQIRQLILAIHTYIEVHSYHSMKFGFSSSEHAAHKRRRLAVLRFLLLSNDCSKSCAAPASTTRSLTSRATAGAAVDIVPVGDILEYNEFRKSSSGAVRSTMRGGMAKSTMELLGCRRRNFEELIIVTQTLSAEGNDLVQGKRCECLRYLQKMIWLTGTGQAGRDLSLTGSAAEWSRNLPCYGPA
jgi:hypothetical protein